MSRPPAPSLQLANDLRSAGPLEFVYLDKRGRVLSRGARRLRSAAHAALGGGIVGGLVVIFGAGVLAPLGFVAAWTGLVWLWRLRGLRKLNRAAVLVLHQRYAEAEELLARVRGPRGLMALVAMNRAAIAAGSGELERELGQRAAAEATFQALHPRLMQYRLINRYANVLCLVNLGRLDAARTALGGTPGSEYLKLHFWTAELYLALAEERTVIDDAELALRIEAACATASVGGLLGLLAWACHQRGDGERAWQLLRVARERMMPSSHRVLRLLVEWANRHAAQAGLASPFR